MRLPSSSVKSVRSRLLDWFDQSKRDLPWRRNPTPYRTLVSEIMLQQTQVETVTPYFRRFLEEFPTFERLAAASEEEVLRLWSGLGYYRRARNLHQAAQAVVKEYGGRFPKDLEDALALPGVGRYTAGAVLSIAYGVQVPLVDGNVERVLSRVFALKEDLTNGKGKKRVWDLAGKLVPEDCPGEFNQALMELGALVCAPIGPSCRICPLSGLCKAFREGIAESLPVKTRKQRQVKVEEVVLLVKNNGRLLLTNRNEEALYQGMWQFPWQWRRIGERSLNATLKRLIRSLGIHDRSARKLHSLSHAVTYRRIATTFFFVEVKEEGELNTEGLRWTSAGDLQREALPGYQKKVLAYLPD